MAEVKEVELRLLRLEGDENIHIGGALKNRTYCDIVFENAERMKPIDVKCSDICGKCQVRYIRRPRDTR